MRSADSRSAGASDEGDGCGLCRIMGSADSRSAGASDEGEGAVCAESCAPPTQGRRGRATKGTVGLVQNHALRRLEVGGGERRRERCGLCRIMCSADSRSAGASDEGDGGVSAESCAPPTRGRRGRATKGTGAVCAESWAPPTRGRRGRATKGRVRFVQNHALRRLKVGGGERRRGRWG